MTDEAALLQAIRDCPADVSRHLIYADWLEEYGTGLGQRERAEFIRVQCALARWVGDLERRSSLQEREQALLRDWRQQWLGGPRPPWKEAVFERGLAQVSIEARRFAARAFTARKADWLNRAAVERVRVLRAKPYLTSLANCPALQEVGSLDLSWSELTDEEALGLLSSPRLARLRCLELSGNNLTAAFAAGLADLAGNLPNLTRLDLRNNLLGDLGLTVLLASPLGARLRWLEFHGNGHDPRRLAEWRQGRTGATLASPERLINSIGMELALLPPGSFLRGSPATELARFDNEGPQHRITLPRPFWIGVYPVTQRQFHAVLGENPSAFGRDTPHQADFPVDSVTWEDAREFCEKLAELPEERRAGHVYRLPSESEWEYACRAGTSSPFAFGDTACGTEGNFGGSEGYETDRRVEALHSTTVVGRYPPNAFGLYDMHGNVQEWCQDWYGEYTLEPLVDPRGPDEDGMKVLRGGSWFVNATRCRSARRNRFYPTSGNDNYGFRVLLLR